jgi:hypothetical protein
LFPSLVDWRRRVDEVLLAVVMEVYGTDQVEGKETVNSG